MLRARQKVRVSDPLHLEDGPNTADGGALGISERFAGQLGRRSAYGDSSPEQPTRQPRHPTFSEITGRTAGLPSVPLDRLQISPQPT